MRPTKDGEILSSEEQEEKLRKMLEESDTEDDPTSETDTPTSAPRCIYPALDFSSAGSSRLPSVTGSDTTASAEGFPPAESASAILAREQKAEIERLKAELAARSKPGDGMDVGESPSAKLLRDQREQIESMHAARASMSTGLPAVGGGVAGGSLSETMSRVHIGDHSTHPEAHPRRRLESPTRQAMREHQMAMIAELNGTVPPPAGGMPIEESQSERCIREQGEYIDQLLAKRNLTQRQYAHSPHVHADPRYAPSYGAPYAGASAYPAGGGYPVQHTPSELELQETERELREHLQRRATADGVSYATAAAQYAAGSGDAAVPGAYGYGARDAEPRPAHAPMPRTYERPSTGYAPPYTSSSAAADIVSSTATLQSRRRAKMRAEIEKRNLLYKRFQEEGNGDMEAAHKSLQEMRSKLASSTYGIDIVIMLDITGSMTSWLEMCKEKIKEVVDSVMEGNIAATHSGAVFRFAFIGYRDYHPDDLTRDMNTFVWTKFVTSDEIDTLKETVDRCVATGGHDAAEDIAGALEIAIQELDWQSSTKLIVHFGDAPCHGVEYHLMGDRRGMDNSPQGDKWGLDPREQMRWLSEHKIDYYFAHINKAVTDRMVDVFKKAYGSCNGLGKMRAIEVGDNPALFLPTVLDSVRASHGGEL